MVKTARPGRSVAYVSYDGLLEPLGASQVVPPVEGLAARGFPMSVLSFEKPHDLDDRGAVGEMRARLAASGTSWLPLRYHRAPTLPATAFDVAMAVRNLRKTKPALVHARSYVAAAMGSLSLRNGGGKLLFDMRGFWVDERIEGQGWSPTGLKVREGRRVERALLNRADHVVHLTKAARARVERRLGALGRSRHTTIPTSVDLERFRVPADRSELRQRLGIRPEGPVLIHAGTLGARYQIGRTLQIGAAFVESSGGTFLVVTRDTEAVSSRARKMGVPVIVRSAAPAEMPDWLGVADFGLALVAPGPAGVASAPTKVGEYLAAGLGVVTTAVGDLENQFAEARYSRVVGPQATSGEVVGWMLSGGPARAREAESRALAETYYGLTAALDLYEAIYRDLGVVPCV